MAGGRRRRAARLRRNACTRARSTRPASPRGTYKRQRAVDGGRRRPARRPPSRSRSRSARRRRGLVGAWGFNEASGTTATDASGTGNPGTLSGATRTTAGPLRRRADVRRRQRLGHRRRRELARPDDRHDAGGVGPADALGRHWRTVVLKEQPGQLVVRALRRAPTTARPSGHVFTSGDVGSRGPAALPLNAWSHLAMTWDGLTMRLYVNGTQVASSALTGTAADLDQPAADRRQRRLARVVRRPDRRGARVQPGAERGRDRGRPRHRDRRRGAAVPGAPCTRGADAPPRRRRRPRGGRGGRCSRGTHGEEGARGCHAGRSASARSTTCDEACPQ